jgi:hypothetical protein
VEKINRELPWENRKLITTVNRKDRYPKVTWK